MTGPQPNREGLCGADLGRTAFPFTCHRTIGHIGLCGLLVGTEDDTAAITGIAGPQRVTVTAIPAGVKLDLSTFVHDLIVEIASDENLVDLMSDVIDALNSDEPADPHQPERLTVERLVDRLDCDLFVYGAAVGRLAESLLSIARPKGVPSQRDRWTA